MIPAVRRLAVLLVLAIAIAACSSADAAPSSSVIMLAPASNGPMGQRDTAYNPVKPAPAL